MSVELFTDIAYAALALLIAVLAIYFTLRLMGKVAKFIVTTVIVIVVGVVLWMIFSDTGASLPVIGGLTNIIDKFKR